MASDVEIANIALVKLGSKTITSFGDNSDQARACNLLFAPTRDAVLEDFPWSFATKRATLAQLVAVPAYGFAHQYQLPTDTVRILETDSDSEPWRREADKILSNRSSMAIKYTAQITDPNQFTPAFRKALSSRLAYELTMAITGKQQLMELMWKLYQGDLARARATDAESQGVELWTEAKERSPEIERPFIDVR
jgi:hypothetical protein